MNIGISQKSSVFALLFCVIVLCVGGMRQHCVVVRGQHQVSSQSPRVFVDCFCSACTIMSQPASGNLLSLPPISLWEHRYGRCVQLHPALLGLWRFKLRSSHLHPNHFTSWGISPVAPL